MNFRTIALAGAATLALSAPAFASNAGWYLGLGVGYDHLDEQVARNPAEPPLGFVFHGGALFEFSGGYKFDGGIRVELEGSYVEHTEGQEDQPPGTPLFKPAGGGTSNSSLLVNAVYDIDIGQGLGAELGAGIGVADINEYLHGHLSSSFHVLGGARTAFEWQLIAGLTYQLDDNIVLFGDYRFREAEVDQSYFNTAEDGNYYKLFRNQEHVALVGLRWYLESEAPPPPPVAPPPPPPPPPPQVKTIAIFFDFDKANLTAEAQERVTEAVKEVKASGYVKVVITGHTDTVGSDNYNQALSVRRAQTVKDEMVRQGVDGSIISIEGKSFHDPLVPTGPGMREPQNRRAVIDLGG